MNIENEYILDLNRRKNKYKKLLYFLASLSLSLFSFVFLHQYTGIPEEIATYLMEENILEFSMKKLEEINEKNTSIYGLYFYLFVYFGSHIFLTSALITLILKLKNKIRKHEKDYLSVSLLNKSVKHLCLKPESKKYKKTYSKQIKKFRFYSSISPIKYKWYEENQYNWLKYEDISYKSKSILLMAHNFSEIVFYSVSNNYKTKDIIVTLDIVESYLLKNSINQNKYINYKYKINNKEELLKIARILRPIQIKMKSEKINNDISIKENIFTRTNATIKNIASISFPAAIIMLIGVFLFKIELTQAFLTWFTVTFGAFAISLGYTKVNVKKNKDKSP